MLEKQISPKKCQSAIRCSLLYVACKHVGLIQCSSPHARKIILVGNQDASPFWAYPLVLGMHRK
jgi:hypothetical protein